MNNPCISIIVPCYKVEQYLDRCLKSLVNQTLKNIEIILVDDGSPDDVPRMCDEWAVRDERIKVIHKQNAGLGFARNSGLEIATGEYVAFVDSDDFVDLNMYQVLYDEALISQADAVFCGFKREHVDGSWKESNEVATREYWESQAINNFMLDMIACAPHVKQERRYQMSVWHAIYRRSIIEKYKMRFESERVVVSEDLPFQVDFLLRASKVVYLPQSFYYYCLNGASLTTQVIPEKYERFENLHSLLLKKINNNLNARLRVDRLYIGYTRSFLLRLQKTKRRDKRTIINRVINDSIWEDIGRFYPPNNLPLYPRIIYHLILMKNKILLQLFCNFINRIRR